MNMTPELKELFIETVKDLDGSARRVFMARVVKVLGPGGQRQTERELGWNRKTIRKGQRELASGLRCVDAYACRGRKRAEEHLPHLLADIRALVDSQSQTDPSFKSQRLYTRLSAAAVRQQLSAQKEYAEAELPTPRTLNTKLRDLGYYPQRVTKCQPRKKIPETDAIFEQLAQVHQAAAHDPTILRVSLDAKTQVKIGPFSRGGQNRVCVQAADHDFKPQATVTPLGLVLPDWDDLFLYFTTSKVTSDFMVDVLARWWNSVRERFPQVKTLLLNLDNGPENHSRRTQFILRLVQFAHQCQLNIKLAHYPPYHSKYNPIERCWGVLENHWNGDLLDEIDTVLQFAKTMTWKGRHPVTVQLFTQTYHTGVKLTAQAMRTLEKQIERLAGLEKWFVTIPCTAPAGRDT